eukprot:g45374.t1
MVDGKSSPVTYKVRVGEMVPNMDHVKAANSQTEQEQNIPGPSEHPARLSEPMCSPSPPSVKETPEDEMDMANVAASTLLPPEDEFLSRRSRCKRHTIVRYSPPESEAEWEELDTVRKHPRESYWKTNGPMFWDL